MKNVVIIDAVRSAIGKRNGSLSLLPAPELLGDVIVGLLGRNPIDPASIGHVVAGCVQQVGAQSANVARNAWLGAGLPLQVPAVTVNTQCGSSQEALTVAHALLGADLVDLVLACGVETMSSIPMGSATPEHLGQPRGGRYLDHYESTTQFEGADRIAARWRIARDDLDRFAKRSHDLAARAWAEQRFDGQIVPVEAPVADDSGAVVGTKTFSRDEGLRDTSLERLAELKTNLDREPAFHTAGTSSQISDGSGALLMTTEERASALGLQPRARVVDSVLVGSDPELMLTGPIPATQALLRRTGLTLGDIDLFEVNEAFAAVVLAWQKELDVDPARVNPNGGAIALGHPLGGTGTILVTKALNELERSSGRYALISMCCGGGLGTGTIIERL